jgi:hypothetical protein
VALYDQPVPIFGREWERLLRGGEQIGLLPPTPPPPGYKPPPPPGAPGNQITVPGFDDVIRIGPRYRPTGPELDEFYNARRERRPPNISREALDSINAYREYRENARNSAQPEWAKGWGNILTAIDNIQDFASTLSSLGRLGLWAGPRAIGALEALLGLEGLISSGAAAKLGGKFVPVLGGLILASDILNLAALLGYVGMVGWGAACQGPSAALAAGAPMMLLKRALKTELWNAARRNPFGRVARLDARSRAVGKLPGLANWFEILQTTEQLTGYGISLGGLIGMLNEAAFAAERASRGEWPTFNVDHAGRSWRRLADPIIEKMSPSERAFTQSASQVLATAPAIMSGQDPFDEDLHLLTFAAYLGALPYVMRMIDQMPWEDVIEEMLMMPFEPPIALGPVFARIVIEEGPDVSDGNRWPLPSSPLFITGKDYLEQMSPRIAAATKQFIVNRNDGAPAVVFGTMVGQTFETLWRHITRDKEGIRFQLAPDIKILSDIVEDGWLIVPNVTPAKFKPFWDAMLKKHHELDRHRIEPAWYLDQAQHYGIPMLKQLPPNAPYPREWLEDVAPA